MRLSISYSDTQLFGEISCHKPFFTMLEPKLNGSSVSFQDSLIFIAHNGELASSHLGNRFAVGKECLYD